MDAGIYRPDTVAAEGNALALKLRDAIHAGLHPSTFGRMVDLANKAQTTRIEDPRTAAGNVLALAGVSSDRAIDDLLGHFLKDYDSTAYGLAQATARYAQDSASAADVEALETAAGAILRGEVALAK